MLLTTIAARRTCPTLYNLCRGFFSRGCLPSGFPKNVIPNPAFNSKQFNPAILSGYHRLLSRSTYHLQLFRNRIIPAAAKGSLQPAKKVILKLSDKNKNVFRKQNWGCNDKLTRRMLHGNQRSGLLSSCHYCVGCLTNVETRHTPKRFSPTQIKNSYFDSILRCLITS